MVEIVLDIGAILNGLPTAVVGTAGSTGGIVNIRCYNQIKRHSPTEAMEIGRCAYARPQPWLPGSDHILLSEDTNITVVDGRWGQWTPRSNA